MRQQTLLMFSGVVAVMEWPLLGVRGSASLLVAFYNIVDGTLFQAGCLNYVRGLHSRVVSHFISPTVIRPLSRHVASITENRRTETTHSRSKLHE